MRQNRMVFFASIVGLALLLAPSFVYGQSSPSLLVTVSVNSGLPNQTFNLTSSADIAQVESGITGLPSVPDPKWVNLGWQGYDVVNLGVTSFPAVELTVLNGVIRVIWSSGATPVFYQDVNNLEGFLASQASAASTSSGSGTAAARSNLASAVVESVPEADLAPVGTMPSSVAHPTPVTDPTPAPPPPPPPPPAFPLSGSEPAFNPAPWNGGPAQPTNNCYNYACNKPTGSFAQPGRASGNPIVMPLSCASVAAAATADGLTAQNCAVACPNGSYKVALVVDPVGFPTDGLGPDFHWYRQDNNGNWSHKPGAGPATNVDTSTAVITNPNLADRRRAGMSGTLRPGYTNFCGCYCVNANPANVNIR